MSNYHLTPEQTLKIFDEAGGILDINNKFPLAVCATDLANTMNLALHKVLGEPVAYRWYESKMEEYRYNAEPNKHRKCEPLYAPKEQS